MDITEPLNRGNIHFKSRIVFPPMATQSSRGSVPGERMTSHYRENAENPLVGLVITEYAYIDQQGHAADPHQVSFASDEAIAPQRAMTDEVHHASPGVKLFAQIVHAGANTSECVTGQQLVSASDIDMGGGPARALSVEEIHEIEQHFAQAALRVKEAGYDGVELHAAHGYLLDEFWSPLTNFRRDEYGPQSVENRARFLVETIRATRATVGDDFPIAVRFGGSDYTRGGSTIEDAAAAAPLIEAAGVDLIDISGGMNGYVRRDTRQPGWFSDLSGAVRAKTSVPVLVTGGITTTDQAKALLDAGAADLVGVGRALFRNPAWGIQH